MIETENMNGSTAINYPINEQLIGKFHVTSIDKLPVDGLNHHDENIPPISSITDESGCTSRFQMIRVDRNFGRGRWKVNDYEPPETIPVATIPLMNTIENESVNSYSDPAFLNLATTTIPNVSANMPAVVPGELNATSSATAASAAVAAATAFQQQQRMAINSTPTLMPLGNVPPQHGLFHGYPSSALANQSYLLTNHHHHHQFGYYPFYPSPYSPYATSWAAAALPYLPHPQIAPPQQQTLSQLSSTGNLNDPIRLTDTGSDINGDHPMISSTNFPNPTADHVQNAQLAAAAASFLYAAHHSHSPFLSQASSTTSPYATIQAYHPVQSAPPQTLPFFQIMSNNTTDIQQSHHAPTLTSPKHDVTKGLVQQSSFITTPKNKPLITPVGNGINNNDPSKPTYANDLISYQPLISPGTVNSPTTTLSNIWSYATTGSPLTLTQTAQTAAVAAMGLLNNENRQNTVIANEILKEILTTPAKQNNMADIDSKISAAMDLVKMHLLSAVREEVTELRQQIRTLNEKINSIEHENTFLRQHVPSEIYAQYIPTCFGLSSSNDTTNLTNNTTSSIPLSSVPITSLSSVSLTTDLQPPLSIINSTPT